MLKADNIDKEISYRRMLAMSQIRAFCKADMTGKNMINNLVDLFASIILKSYPWDLVQYQHLIVDLYWLEPFIVILISLIIAELKKK